VSAIIQHSGEVGSAREYFVHSVLRRFLPSNVVVGRGEIVDGRGGRSRQQDLLLYRSNFPVIDSLAGSHLYLAEGVLATIEVKSNLDEKELIRATQNIESVRVLAVSEFGVGDAEDVDGGDVALDELSYENMGRRIGRGGTPIPLVDPLLSTADERIWTYVFAFDGVSFDTLNVGDVEAGASIAGLYTLVATCEARGINPFAYLADVIPRVQDHPKRRLDELLPGPWSRA
jgi:hypothetical protein